MGSSPDEEDIERVERDYVDPTSTSRKEVAQDLAAEGFPQSSLEAFTSRTVSEEDVEVPDRQVVTREQVSSAVGEADEIGLSAARREEITTEISKQEAAPTESALTQARGQAARNVDESGTVRSNPDLDPFGGDSGREIGEVPDIADATGGRDASGYTEAVERTGDSTGVYSIEDPDGNRYPIAEVDLS